mmetsp:Transcript_108372/g.312226  ORF Transcript_108372/g.312226 Transcript_108372/m.312226 type:complete len:94 (+) Transcript_108372:456-737(+)
MLRAGFAKLGGVPLGRHCACSHICRYCRGSAGSSTSARGAGSASAVVGFHVKSRFIENVISVRHLDLELALERRESRWATWISSRSGSVAGFS